jgi:hypothetical protein
LNGRQGNDIGGRIERNARQLRQKLRQQEVLYTDRLEGRISEQLFSRVNRQLEERLERLRQEAARLASEGGREMSIDGYIGRIMERLERGDPVEGIIRCAVVRITVFDDIDHPAQGLIVVDFIMNKV